jgi:purine-binding chemotaxis protein CheW
MDNTYLSFKIGSEFFAVNVTKVLEVLHQQPVTKVPSAPHYVKGIINFRGEVVPVFETRDKFNMPSRDGDDSFVIIVFDLSTETEVFRIGAIADRVEDVIVIRDEEIKPVPAMSKDFNTEFIEGIFKLRDDFILLLNVEKVFSNSEIINIKHSNQTEEITK